MPERPRHIIWITTDHMRFDCIRAHGNPAMHTPNIDRLVNNGVSFHNCFVNNPLCMPSRASFMTGCYPQATGVQKNGQELRPDFEPVVAKEFKAAGYRTLQVGKLHFQCHEDHDLDPRARHDYGFNVLQLSEEPGCYEDAYRTWLRGEHPDWVETFTVPRSVAPDRRLEAQTFRTLDAPWELSHSGWVAEQACRHLEPLRQPNSFPPLFLHLGFYAPHPPLNPTREMMEPYRDLELPPPLRRKGDPRDLRQFSDETLTEYRRHFYGMITGVDLALGKILRQLEDLEILDQTLIVFSSDHGDACGDHGRVAKGPTYLEGIIKMPLIFHWPAGFGTQARIEPGLFEMVDLLPTLVELVGKPLNPAFQGRSIATELLQGSDIPGRPDVYGYHGDGDIYLRDHRWKYIAYLREDSLEEFLFDLENDPGEFTNLAGSPDQRDQLEKMRLRALQRSTRASQSPLPRRLRY